MIKEALEIAPNVHLFIGATHNSNTTVFVDGDEALLIDALGGLEDAAELRQLVENEWGKRVRVIVATHYFSDHMAGLKLFHGARIIAHENAAHTFSTEVNRTPEEATRFVEPHVQLSASTLWRWGGYRLGIFPNPGHTMGTLNIDVPEANLLFVGDTIVGNIGYFHYTAPELLEGALSRAKARGRERLIASHGGVVASSTLDNALEYLGNLRRRVEERRKTNPDAIGQITIEECLPAGLEPRGFETTYHARNLRSIVARNLYSLS